MCNLPFMKSMVCFENNMKSAQCALCVIRDVLEQLMRCVLVISTSLHGLIFAEAFGIPSRWLRSSSLPSFAEGTHKFNDHLTSTGRAPNSYATSIEEAVARGGTSPIALSLLRKRQQGMLFSFPFQVSTSFGNP